MAEDNEFSLDPDKGARVREVMQEFETWARSSEASRFRDRMERNFKMYSGVDGSQWPDDAKRMLKEQGRPLHTFNFVQGVVQNTLGQLEQQPFETHFDPISPNSVDNAGVLQELYDYDFERGDWEFAKMSMKRDGLVVQGVLQMFVDYRHDPLGNVGLKAVNPAHVFFDPYWQTTDMFDCRGVFKTTWMTASQVKRDYHKRTAEIQNAIARDRWATQNEDVVEKIFDRTPEWYDSINSQYKVVEFMYIQRVTKKRAFNELTGKFDGEFDKPEQQALSDENFVAMMNLQGNALTMKKEAATACKIITICPALGLDLILEEGDYPLQLGRLPFVTWSAENVYGERQGVVDLIADAQNVLNKRESTATQILGMQGNPNYFIEEGAFIDKGEENKFRRSQTRGGQAYLLQEGGSQRVVLQDRGAPPNEMWAAADRAQRWINELPGNVSASRAQSEGANESGLLFDAKREQALVRLEMYNKGLKRVDQEIGEMYFYAAKQVYAGPTRHFKNKKSGKETMVNRFMTGAFGEVVVADSIADLQRHNILVSEAPMGTTKKREFLSKYIELAGVISNPILRAGIEKEIIKYADLPQSVTANADKDAEMFRELQEAQTMLQIATAKQQTQQIQGPQQPQSAQGGPGFLEQLDGALTDAADISKLPGMGNLPNNAGVAGGESAVNNTENQAPSDLGRR